MPLCQSCGDTGPGVYCSACGERREPRTRRERREPEVSPLHVREALFAHQRAMEEMYGVDDTPQTPNNFAFRSASEMRWCNLRALMQSRMVFDEEWIVDTPRSELLWQATCLQQGIERSSGASGKRTYANDGPVGFTWWGGPLPQTVEIVDLGDEQGGLSRVKVSVDLGRIRGGSTGKVLHALGGNRFPVPGSALIIDRDDHAKLVMSVAMDSSMIAEVADFVDGMLARQVVHGLLAQEVLAGLGAADIEVRPHPELGTREDLDELVALLVADIPFPSRGSPDGRPASPEGVLMPDLFTPAAATAAARMCGLSFRDDRVWFDDPRVVLMAPAGHDDPAVYFAYQPVEMSERLGLYPDPGALMWLQRGGRRYASEDEALAAANDALVGIWHGDTHNILGGFRVAADERGADEPVGQWALMGPVSLWPATMLSTALGRPPEDVAELIWHIHMHLYDQNEGLLRYLS